MTMDELALQLANRALTNGFDPEGYIVKYIAETKLEKSRPKDDVPESRIDENIKLLLDLFISYYDTKSVQTLEHVMLILRQIVTELYHAAETRQEKEVIKEFVTKVQLVN